MCCPPRCRSRQACVCNQKPPFRAHTQTHKLSILFAWRERRSAHAGACGRSSSGAVGEGWGDYVGTELLHKVTPPKLARRTPGESGITTMLGWTKEPGPKLRHKLRAHRKHTKNIVRCGQPHHHVARLPRSKPSPVTGQGAVCLHPTRRGAKVSERSTKAGRQRWTRRHTECSLGTPGGNQFTWRAGASCGAYASTDAGASSSTYRACCGVEQKQQQQREWQPTEIWRDGGKSECPGTTRRRTGQGAYVHACHNT